MDVMLQHHNAKHVCDIPDGLRELCADISREVIRWQPEDIYCFIADYLDSLMITRENAKIAMKVVQNVTLGSEQIVEILASSGLRLEEIAAAAPRLQKAFRAYLEAVDEQKKACGCDDNSEIDVESEISICGILKETGTTYEEAQCAATKIQSLFRGHRERMILAEKRGEIQWQRAAINTMEIFRKLGVSQSEASQAATVIQSVYRGYYTRRNLRLTGEMKETVDMSTWLDVMYENTGLTLKKANGAATIIQTAYRRYRERRHGGSRRELSTATSSPSKTPSGTTRDKFAGSVSAEVASASKEFERRIEMPSTDDDSTTDSKEVRFRSHVTVSTSSTVILLEESDDIEDLKDENDFFISSKSAENSLFEGLEKNKDNNDVIGENEDAQDDMKIKEENTEDQNK